MRINNNIMAMNTHRQYAINNDNMAGATKKLSSGYRINSAADDAAGMAISEKMRAQIRGLDMASKNSEDAISLVQTAEGALEETESILQRMRELSVQSASDTNEDSVDRAALDAEYQQLIAEIDDISSKTDFNGKSLLDGSLADTIATAFSGTDEVVYNGSGTQNADLMSLSLDTNTNIDAGDYTLGGYAAAGSGDPAEFTLTDGSTVYTVKAAASGETDFSSGSYDVYDSDDNVVGSITLSAEEVTAITTASDLGDYDMIVAAAADQTAITGGMAITNSTGTNAIAEGSYTMSYTDSTSAAALLTLTDGTNTYTVAAGTSIGDDFAAGTYNVEDASGNTVGTITLDAAAAASIANENAVDFASVTVTASDITFQTGANEGDTLSIKIGNMSAVGLSVNGTDIGTRTTASSSISTVNSAINSVSTQRAQLGALQNRLEHKINNLNTSAENLQSAESRIRDVDMAQEMTEYTQTSILVQAATSMLAQANAAPQNVLSLLQ